MWELGERFRPRQRRLHGRLAAPAREDGMDEERIAEDYEMAHRARRLAGQRPHARASPRRRGTEPRKAASPTGRGAGGGQRGRTKRWQSVSRPR